MPTPEKTYQSILRKLSLVSVEALPQIDLYLQDFVEKKKTVKKKPIPTPVIELPTHQRVSDEQVLTLWTNRPETAQEIAREIRQRNRQIT